MESTELPIKEKKAWIKPEVELLSSVPIESGAASTGVESQITANAGGQTGPAFRHHS